MNKSLYFFIGTEAELMKIFPVFVRCKNAGYDCKIISNGQHDISSSPFLEMTNHGKVDINICAINPEKRSMGGHASWFIKTEKKGKVLLKQHFSQLNKENILMIVHGDTLSTVMGARLAHACKVNYVHIESGYRSFNYLSPFPEELDRLYSSLKSKINFTVGDVPTKYAMKRFKGRAVDTVYNTGLETLFYALKENENREFKSPINGDYFVFAMHRQENLMSKKFMTKTVDEICKLADRIPCIAILHKQSEDRMKNYNIYDKIKQHKNIHIIPRQPYLEFINIIEKSKFVVTDGCGNQQEFFYLGKPYLIMRTKVEEASEGLNWNAKVFNNDFSNISKFLEEYPAYTKERIIPKVMPSEIIVKALNEYFIG